MSYKNSRSWLFLITIIICLGIFFRVANLERKIYWVDEVSTSLRVSGYTKQEVISQLSQQSIISISDLQKYQKLSPTKNWSDTLEALKTSPEHSPFYFLLIRGWLQIWGSSIAAIRSLSVIFSLIALVCLYFLGKELFASERVSIIAVLLMAVSPFFVAYAQEARPYSLWTLTILVSSITLLRAIRYDNWFSWTTYSLSLMLSLYTSLLSVLVIISQAFYVTIISFFSRSTIGDRKQDNFSQKRKLKTKPSLINFQSQTLTKFSIAAIVAVLGFSPWLLVILSSWQTLEDNTVWMQGAVDLLPMIAVWLYSIPILFIESPIYLPIDFSIIIRILIDFNLFILIGFSFYFLIKKAELRISIFILTSLFLPRLILILNDVIRQQQVSAAPRYTIPLYIGLELSVAYLLAQKIFNQNFKEYKSRRKWIIVLVCAISIGIISCTFNLNKSPKYQKTRNIDNPAIANIINRSLKTVVVSEESNVLDLISLSYSLNREVKMKVLNSNPSNFLEDIATFKNIFFLNPSDRLKITIERQQEKHLEKVYQPNLLIPDEIHLSLWKLQ